MINRSRLVLGHHVDSRIDPNNDEARDVERNQGGDHRRTLTKEDVAPSHTAYMCFVEVLAALEVELEEGNRISEYGRD